MNIRSILAAAALFPALSAAHDFRANPSVEAHALRQVREGRDTFRFATFGDEAGAWKDPNVKPVDFRKLIEEFGSPNLIALARSSTSGRNRG